MAALARRAADENAQLLGQLAAPLAFRSVRGIRYFGNERCAHPTYLAEAGGHFFQRPVALVARRRRRFGFHRSRAAEPAEPPAIVSSESNDRGAPAAGRRSAVEEGIP